MDYTIAFKQVADWCQEYLELQHSRDVGRDCGALLRSLGRLAAGEVDPAAGDRFEQLKALEADVSRLLSDLAVSHAECLRQVSATAAPDNAGQAPTLLFVYGTLKRGFSRAYALQGQRFVGPVLTRPLYKLYDCGDYPALVAAPTGESIEGELWEVDAACLARLDDIEGVSLNLYRRGPLELLPPHEQARVVSYFYQRSVAGLPDCGRAWPTTH